MKAPQRLLDDPALAMELRLDLERAAAAREPYDVARGEAKLTAALAIGAAKPAGGAGAELEAFASQASSTALSGAALKVGLTVAAASVIGATLFWVAPSREAKPPAPSDAPRTAEAESAPAAPAPEGDRPSEAAPASESAKAAPAVRRSPDVDAELRRETAQLGRIKQLLEGHPARAYALAQSGHREFERGMLREEREALAVLALWNLGEDQRARQRTEAFLARYPSSAVRGQLERRLASARRSDAQDF